MYAFCYCLPFCYLVGLHVNNSPLIPSAHSLILLVPVARNQSLVFTHMTPIMKTLVIHHFCPSNVNKSKVQVHEFDMVLYIVVGCRRKSRKYEAKFSKISKITTNQGEEGKN